MPRVKKPSATIAPIPNTRSLAEVRAYRVGVGEQSWIVRIRHIVEIAASLTEMGLNFLEELHNLSRERMIADHGEATEIGNERIREARLYFSGDFDDALKIVPNIGQGSAPASAQKPAEVQSTSAKAPQNKK